MYIHSNPCGALNVKDLKCGSRSFIFTLHPTRFRVKARVRELKDNIMNSTTQSKNTPTGEHSLEIIIMALESTMDTMDTMTTYVSNRINHRHHGHYDYLRIY